MYFIKQKDTKRKKDCQKSFGFNSEVSVKIARMSIILLPFIICIIIITYNIAYYIMLIITRMQYYNAMNMQ